jgi:hypothetical protein
MPGLNVKVYECHVTGVRENDRVVDVRSRNGTVFKQVSYLLPWISSKGSGIDVIPKTGDQCMVLASSQMAGKANKGGMAMVIGFKIPTSPEYAGIELGGRMIDMPQGSIVIRALADSGDEAHLILSSGGSLLIGANDACRTLYSPVDSSIIHVFNNWEMIGPGGYVKWLREEASDAVSYEAEYRTLVDPEQSALRVKVRIGGEGDDPVDVVVGADDTGENPFLRVRVTADGEAFIEGESINIIGRAGVTIDGSNVTIKGRQVLGQGDPI